MTWIEKGGYMRDVRPEPVPHWGPTDELEQWSQPAPEFVGMQGESRFTGTGFVGEAVERDVMRADDFLRRAADHMAARAATYDQPGGERSMGKAVQAFNAVAGRDMTEAEGWMFMLMLKNVRLFQRAGFHRDSAEDAVAYAALLAEAKQGEVA